MISFCKYSFYFIALAVVITACSPKEVNTDPVKLSSNSKSWIPFEGSESVVFEFDTLQWTFMGTDKETYFENVRYLTEQSGFITLQKDYYADLERQHLEFTSSSTEYFISYHLQKNKGEMGEWDILTVTLTDGFYYHNDLTVVIKDDNDFDKGESYRYKSSLKLNGITFQDVYYWRQDRRPFELYYTQEQGVVGFKISTNELWTIKTD